MIENFELKIKNKKFFLIDQTTNLVVEGISFDSAYKKLKEKLKANYKIKKEIGFNPSKLNDKLKIKSKELSYFKKWLIAFFFISLISISISYSISNGIKNGLNGVDFPKGNKVWTIIGDNIIKSAQSESIKDKKREAEIIESLEIIKNKLQPYLNFFSQQTDCVN